MSTMPIEIIKNKEGQNICPLTHPLAVIDDDGKNMSQRLNEKQPTAINGVDCPHDGNGNYSPQDNTNYNDLGVIGKLFLAVPINFPNGSKLSFTAAEGGCSLGWQVGTKWSNDDPSGVIEAGASYMLVMLDDVCTIIKVSTPTPVNNE